MKKKVAIVTGGARGIGRAVAELFAKRGFKVVVCSRTGNKKTSSSLFFQSVDVREKDQVAEFVQSVARKFGRVDVLVNAAGVSRWKEVAGIDDAFMRDVYETNVMGTLWSSAAAGAAMKKGGAIINVSSLAGKRGSANNSAYCASKFAVNGITQSLAKEFGPRGIRVNAVCPVYVVTDMILKSLEETASPAGGKSVKEYLKNFSKTQTALGRLPTEAEVAEAVFFLASDAASGITGQCVNVDCGTMPQ